MYNMGHNIHTIRL